MASYQWSRSSIKMVAWVAGISLCEQVNTPPLRPYCVNVEPPKEWEVALHIDTLLVLRFILILQILRQPLVDFLVEVTAVLGLQNPMPRIRPD